MRYLMCYSRRQMTATTHLSCSPGCLDFWGWMPSFSPGQVPLPETQTRCTPKIRLQPSFQGRSWKRLERACTFGTAQNRSLLSCPGCWLLLAVQRVVRAQALFARPCSHRPISGRNRRRPDSSQESMREQPEPRTQHKTAKRKTGFQFIITTSPLNCRWTQRRAQGAQITGTASTSSRSNPDAARTSGPAFSFLPLSLVLAHRTGN